jgi:hypothetical protein
MCESFQNQLYFTRRFRNCSYNITFLENLKNTYTGDFGLGPFFTAFFYPIQICKVEFKIKFNANTTTQYKYFDPIRQLLKKRLQSKNFNSEMNIFRDVHFRNFTHHMLKQLILHLGRAVFI